MSPYCASKWGVEGLTQALAQELPTGMAAVLENPPEVVASVRAYLNGAAIPVTRATLAPGYIGFYLIEVQLPAISNAGASELYISADGSESNRVQVVIEP